MLWAINDLVTQRTDKSEPSAPSTASVSLCLIPFTPTQGQQPTTLEAHKSVERDITVDEKHMYLVEPCTGKFLYGELGQISADVVIVRGQL